jgi:hypothetical protein
MTFEAATGDSATSTGACGQRMPPTDGEADDLLGARCGLNEVGDKLSGQGAARGDTIRFAD